CGPEASVIWGARSRHKAGRCVQGPYTSAGREPNHGDQYEVMARANSGGGFMFLGVPLDQLAWLAAVVFVAGIVTGIFAGLFGIGGGGIIVPVLFEAFRILGVPEDVRM